MERIRRISVVPPGACKPHKHLPPKLLRRVDEEAEPRTRLGRVPFIKPHILIILPRSQVLGADQRTLRAHPSHMPYYAILRPMRPNQSAIICE